MQGHRALLQSDTAENMLIDWHTQTSLVFIYLLFIFVFSLIVC